MIPSMPERPQPIVLVGGRSRRFGRDKLREPCSGSAGGLWLVDQPRLVLRELLGPPVWAVGDCDALVAARFDVHLPDTHPGAGPAGGILAALENLGAAVFVLSGDLPAISAADLAPILREAAANTDADAVIAQADRVEPCVGIYRPSCIPALRDALTPAGSESLRSVLSRLAVLAVPLGPGSTRNINRPGDLETLRE